MRTDEASTSSRYKRGPDKPSQQNRQSLVSERTVRAERSFEPSWSSSLAMNARRRSMFPPPLLKKLRNRRRYSARRTKPLASAWILTAALRRRALSHCAEGDVETQQRRENKEQRVKEACIWYEHEDGVGIFLFSPTSRDDSPVWCVSSRTLLFGRRGMPARRQRRLQPLLATRLGLRVGRLGTPRKM